MGEREREERKEAHGWVSGLSMNLKGKREGCKERN